MFLVFDSSASLSFKDNFLFFVTVCEDPDQTHFSKADGQQVKHSYFSTSVTRNVNTLQIIELYIQQFRSLHCHSMEENNVLLIFHLHLLYTLNPAIGDTLCLKCSNYCSYRTIKWNTTVLMYMHCIMKSLKTSLSISFSSFLW